MKRISEYINQNWLFSYGQKQEVEKTENFEDFDKIGLPHSFTTPYKGERDFYVGYGVYIKELVIPKAYLGKRIILEFGAVFQVAEIYLNGKYVTKHEGGYTAFTADISNAVEGKNIIVVRVNNIWSPTIAPRAGEHTFCGGIYRDVKLIVTDKEYIEWYGIAVATPCVTQVVASVEVSAETLNCIGKTLIVEIFDREKIVSTERRAVELNEEKIVLRVDSPKLWDIDTPHLYKLKCTVGEDCDEVNFGIRYFEWTKDKGFFLNGKHLLLQGANVHQDHGGWGDAATHSGISRDVKMMKDCGMNFIRGSHYPHHTFFADECDRLGLLFWSEGVFWGIGGFSDEGYWDSSAMPTRQNDYAEFEKSLKNAMKEMIKTNRNHPSIVAWSVGNEIFFSKKSVMQDAKKLTEEMVSYAKKLDSRPVGVGGAQREDFDRIGDIAGYNGDGAVLFTSPKLPSLVAEYGSIPSYRPGKYSLNLTKGSDDFYDFRAGRAIWCGFHHGSIADIGNLGIVDLYRLPLKAWYAYREKYLNIPPTEFAKAGTPFGLRITADKQTISSDGLEDTMLTIEAVDKKGIRVSCDIEVTLTVSGGGILPTGTTMKFNKADKNFFDGACAIELRAYYSGESVITANAEGISSDKITIKVLGTEQYNGQEIFMPQEPSFEKRKVAKGVDIVAGRPIIVSSEQYKGMSCNISDGTNSHWQPLESDEKPTVIIDLENMYSNFLLTMKLKSRAVCNFTVKVSENKTEWLDKGKLKFNWLLNKKSLKIIGNGYRFLKIDGEHSSKIVQIERIEAKLI